MAKWEERKLAYSVFPSKRLGSGARPACAGHAPNEEEKKEGAEFAVNDESAGVVGPTLNDNLCERRHHLFGGEYTLKTPH